MTNLTDLLSRTKEAVGADRELDAAVAEYIGEGPGEGWTLIKQDNPRVFNMDAGRWIKGGVIRTPKPYSASTDAALALVERLFGTESTNMLYSYNLNWHASAHADMSFTADLHIAVGDPPNMQTFHGQARTQPLAILVAFLTALTTL